MNEENQRRLRELTEHARTAFADVPQGDIERSVDTALAEVRQEMSEEFERAGAFDPETGIPTHYDNRTHQPA